VGELTIFILVRRDHAALGGCDVPSSGHLITSPSRSQNNAQRRALRAWRAFRAGCERDHMAGLCEAWSFVSSN
jgi:hypothetical protein